MLEDAKFALQFQSPAGLPDAIAERMPAEADSAAEPVAGSGEDDDGNIVTLDAFRKK